jgi:hypothetical protein
MGYQKISDKTEDRMRDFIEKSLNGKVAKRGRKPGWARESYTFDEALSMLLKEVGF